MLAYATVLSTGMAGDILRQADDLAYELAWTSIVLAGAEAIAEESARAEPTAFQCMPLGSNGLGSVFNNETFTCTQHSSPGTDWQC